MKLVISIVVILSLAAYNSANKVEQELEALICKGFAEGADLKATCGMEDVINNAVESVRTLLKNGDPEKGIRPLDPLLVKSLILYPNSPILSGHLDIENLELRGITEFIKTEGCFDFLRRRVTLGLTFDQINLIVEHYTGNINLFEMIDIYGTGEATIGLTDLRVNIAVDVTITLKLKAITAVVVLPAIETKLTGLHDDEYMSDIISRQLSATLTALAKEEEQRINTILNGILAKLVEQINGGGATFAGENCYNTLAGIKQSLGILTKKDFLMNWFTKNYLN